MRNVFLMIASVMGCLAARSDPVAAQTMALANVEIRMVKTSTKPPLRITADTRNPNDFAVRDIEVECTFKDRAGTTLATSTSTIYATLPPNLRLTTRNLNIGAWPPQSYAALCVSKRAMRVAEPATPPAPPTAPAAAK